MTNQNRVASDWRTYRTCFNSQPSPGCPTCNEHLSFGNRDSYVVQNWKPVNRKTTTIKQVFQPVKQVLPVEHSSSISTSMNVVVSSRFTEMPVTSYKRKAKKAPDVSVRCSHHDDVCSYQFRPRSSDNKKSVRVRALYLWRKRNLLRRSNLTSESYQSYFNFHLITMLNP
nr:hypothetical protein [Tanacetum cinerariifolium]